MLFHMQKQEMKNVQILENLSKTAMRKVSTGAMLVKVIANISYSEYRIRVLQSVEEGVLRAALERRNEKK